MSQRRKRHRQQPLLLRGGYTYLDAVVQRSFTNDDRPCWIPSHIHNGIPVAHILRYKVRRPFRRAPHTGYFSANSHATEVHRLFSSAFASRSDDSTYLCGEHASGAKSLLLPNRNLDFGYASWTRAEATSSSHWLGIYAQANNLLSEQHIAPIGYPSLPMNFHGASASIGESASRPLASTRQPPTPATASPCPSLSQNPTRKKPLRGRARFQAQYARPPPRCLDSPRKFPSQNPQNCLFFHQFVRYITPHVRYGTLLPINPLGLPSRRFAVSGHAKVFRPLLSDVPLGVWRAFFMRQLQQHRRRQTAYAVRVLGEPNDNYRFRFGILCLAIFSPSPSSPAPSIFDMHHPRAQLPVPSSTPPELLFPAPPSPSRTRPPTTVKLCCGLKWLLQSPPA